MKRKIEEILPEGQETFSPKEVSALIPVNETTVSRWCVANKIECTKPMGRWYITRSAVAKLLVAFGLASHLLATGMQSAAKTIPNTRKIFHERMIQQGKAEGWNTNRSQFFLSNGKAKHKGPKQAVSLHTHPNILPSDKNKRTL